MIDNSVGKVNLRFAHYNSGLIMFGLFSKNTTRQVVINDTTSLVLAKNETLLNGALRHGVRLPHSCKVGGCGSCKCRLVEGKVREFTDTSYLLSKQELQSNTILACQSAPRSDVVVEFSGWRDDIEEFQGRIIDQVTLTHDIAEITIELDRPIHYQAGQYGSLKALDTEIPPRCYSFAHRCAVNGSQCVSFFVRSVEGGGMSNWLLDKNQIGKAIRLMAPQGSFYLRDTSMPVLAVAGGSGLAPLVALLEDAIEREAKIVKQPLTLFFGVRSQRDIYYQEQLEQLAKQWQNTFHFLPALSAEPDTSDWQGARGRVTEFIDPSVCQQATAYLCGPPPMLDAAIEKMTQAGMPENRIFFDKFTDQSGASV